MPLQKSHSESSVKKSSSSKKLRKSASHGLLRNRIRTHHANKQVPAAPPTIACFMSAIGETQQEESLSTPDVANLMDRDVLKLSSKWSHAVSQNDILNTGINCANEFLENIEKKASHGLQRNRIGTLQANKQVPVEQPTIACFMSAIGETQQEESLSTPDVANLMDRDVLKLSSKWSHAVSQNDILNTGINCANELTPSTNLYEYEQTLSSECAKLEVEAIASMASLTSSADNSRRGGEINESWDDFETDQIDEEEEKLNIFAEHLNCDFRQLMIETHRKE
eukprot:CAMPEP_0194448498 /NCGR_PEP_ID=MMETSP0176-20130528/129608_1 /TAXON_ID=216777 /ORGANISM="Proboscia alata, Strain PI-D3" /LENGTH=280 /DNA_ID=CAMNT_0039275487 /DNA_START=24 /DNA_END=867 /DNA_ORIENTATION=-